MALPAAVMMLPKIEASPVLALALLALPLLSFALLLLLRWALRTGKELPIQKGYTVRRWYCPGKSLSDEQLLSLQLHMKDVCLSAIGTVLAYPAFTARTAAEIRAEMHNKIIMLIRHCKSGKVVCFNMAFISSVPHVHLGLVVVADGHQGRGLQKYCLLNVGAVHLDWLTNRFHVSDLGFSSSGWRLFSKFVNQSYPNLQYDVSQRGFHRRVAEAMMGEHRKDCGVSSQAVFDSLTFVCRGANDKNGGGADALVPFARTRISRTNIAQQLLEARCTQASDEQLLVGESNLLTGARRAFIPVETVTRLCAWTQILACMALNVAAPDRTWYFRLAVRRLGFKLRVSEGVDPCKVQPCVWVCNHLSFADLLVIKSVCPKFAVVAKRDMLEELPAGWKKEGFRKSFTKLKVLWYDRYGKDDTIRERIAQMLAAGYPVLVFAEGTTQRSGRPMRMYSGAVEIAKAAGVPIMPVCIRYNLPIGLAKIDNPLANAVQIMSVGGKRVSIRFMAPRTVTDIDEVRTAITEAYNDMA